MTQLVLGGGSGLRPGGATAWDHATEDVRPRAPSLTRRRMALLMPAGLLAACQAPRPNASGPAGAGDAHPAMAAGPTASIGIQMIEASFIGSVSGGSGTLAFQGHSHRFRVGGLGVGGIGVSRGTAVGDVYGLTRLTNFPGLYGQLRIGAVVANREVLGGLWLENRAGVRMHLRPREEGLALRVGADGLLVQFT